MSESLSVALFMFLIFGTVCFYLYSRMSYTEKRVSLIENMLLDIKMTMDAAGRDEPEFVPEPVGRPMPVLSTEGEMLPSLGGGMPDANSNEENLYKNILSEMRDAEEISSDDQPFSSENQMEMPQEEEEQQQRPPSPPPAPSSVKVTPNYEAMIKSELIALCEKRQLKVSGKKQRADLIGALRKYDEQQQLKSGNSSSEITGNPHTGDLFPLSAEVGDSGEGFSVDLGGAETLE